MKIHAFGPETSLNKQVKTVGNLLFVLVLGLALIVAPRAYTQNVPINVLHSFTDGPTGDGTSPTSLIAGTDGNFYGVATGGGANGYGTFFRMSSTGAFAVLYSFTAPPGKLVEGKDGNFYGFTAKSGSSDQNTLFQLSPTGTFTSLYRLSGANNLIGGGDGNLYATTPYGSNFKGSIAKVSTAGKPLGEKSVIGDSLASFPFIPGITQSADGSIYFATETFFDDPCTVQKLAPTGVLTTLYVFSPVDGYGINGDGIRPTSLILGNDGNLYGTTGKGGKNGFGTFFMLTPAGALINLHDKTQTETDMTLRTQATDGTFYGTTVYTIFSFIPATVPVTLHTFPYVSVNGNVTSVGPNSLIQGSDGNFYGAGTGGGDKGVGSLLEFNPAITNGSLSFAAATQTIEERAGSINLTVQRTRGSVGAVSVTATTGNGTAIAATDYTSTKTILNWADGDASAKTVTIPIIDRSLRGGSTKTFTVSLSSATGGSAIGDVPTASVNILENDPLPTVTVTSTTPTVTVDSGGRGIFTLTLSEVQATDIVVSYTLKGSAMNGEDYGLTKEFKKIKAGKISKAIKIIPQGDLGGANKVIVALLLQPGDGYIVGTTEKMKVKILAKE